MLLIHLSDLWSKAIAWTVVHSIWQGMAIAIVTSLILIGLRNKSANHRYKILSIAMISVLISAAITMKYYLNQSEMSVGQNFVLTNQSPMIDHGFTAVDGAHETGYAQNIYEEISRYINNNILFIIVIWFVGLCISILRLLGGISYVYVLRTRMNFAVDTYWQELLDNLKSKLDITKTIELAESALVRSPIVVGLIKPMILFPIGAINRLSESEVEGILAHELAHIMRHDYLINIIQNIVESLFYYHPGIWWLSNQLRTERENCCDDIAIQLTSNPLQYAKSLVAAQDMAFYTPALAMAFAGEKNQSQLMLRINRILTQPTNLVNTWEKWISSSVLLGLIVVISIAARPNNAPSCLPEVALNPTYIKFDLNGHVDSMELDRRVPDGLYEHYDRLQSIVLNVHENKVTTLEINGLNVVGEDIKKFRNLIEFVIDHPSKTAVDEPDPALIEEIINLQGQNGAKIDLMVRNQRGYAADVYIDGNLTSIILDANDIPFINGIETTDEAIRELGWEINENGLSLINPRSPNNLDIRGNEKRQNSRGSKQVNPTNQNPNQNENREKSCTDVSESQSDKGEVIIINSYPKHLHHAEHDFDDWLKVELVADKLIKPSEDFHYALNTKMMTVNDRTISLAYHRKYLQQYKKITSQDPDEQWFKTGNFSF
jgi:beta-lactamase regulating signal transducer with metallopeptidase domain